MWVVGLYATSSQSHSHPHSTLPFEQRWDKALLNVCKQSHTCCRLLTTCCRPACTLAGHVMSLQILSYGSYLKKKRPSPSSFCFLSNPARTTLMTSAVKTKRVRISSSSAPCPTAGPWRPVLARGGRSQELGLEGSRCLV